MSFQYHSRHGWDCHHVPALPHPMESTKDHYHHHHARFYTPTVQSPYQQNLVPRFMGARGCSMEEWRDWSHARRTIGDLEHVTQSYRQPLHQPTSLHRFTTHDHNLEQRRSWDSTGHRIGYPTRYYEDQGRIQHQNSSFPATNKAFITTSSRRHSLPPPRPEIVLSSSVTDSNGQAFPRLSVMTYNVLAQDLIEKNGYLYAHAKTEHLEWVYRRVRILHELVQSKADVVCLQEVQEEHYQSFFVPQMHSQGYDSLYQKRTGDHVDGCAVFYLTKRLHLVSSSGVEYQRHTGALDRDNVGLIARLRFVKDCDRRTEFCIATTHLLFNPKAGEVKLAQLSLLLAELHELASDGETLLPCILCGDFNTVPNAPLLDFILNGRLDYSNISAHLIAGYFRHSGSRLRTIPFPLLPDSLHIGQDCIYQKRETSPDGAVNEVQPVSEVAMEDATSPSGIEHSPATTTPINIIDLTLSSDDHREQTVIVIDSVDKKDRAELPGCATVSNTASSSTSTSADLPPTNKPLLDLSSHSSSTSCAADSGDLCSSLPLVLSRKRPNPDSRLKSSIQSPKLTTQSSKPEVTAVLTHSFSFQSAYPLPRDHRNSPSITTYHSSACEMVDYMFYTPVRGHRWAHSCGFHLTSRKALPSTHSLFKLGPQPNQMMSSDHLYLLADFQLMGSQR